ncbi:MAG: antibiotic biosynthesis monooxygenase [Saprospiraceae bacterium]
MILRIYKVTVPKDLHTEFEAKFKVVATTLQVEYEGLLSVEIARPSEWKPLEFMMISKWETVAHIKKMAGEDWNLIILNR